jgi:uncharacterized protein
MGERFRETIRIRIPAREGVAVELRKGYRVSVIDLAGHQGADCVAVTPGGAVSCTRTTRAMNRRLFPKAGQSIYADDNAAVLTLLEDTSSGPHGLLVPPCDPTMYRLRGAGCAHPSCHDNFHNALADPEAIDKYLLELFEAIFVASGKPRPMKFNGFPK